MRRGLLALLLGALGAPAAQAAALELRCDPRVDLLGVVQVLAGRRKGQVPLPPGLAELPKRFAAWRGHPAVKGYERVVSRGGGKEPLVLLLSAVSDPPELAWTRPRSALSVDFIARAGGPEAVERFLGDLRDFARRSGAPAWLKAREGECRKAQAAARAELGGREPLAELESYLGVRLEARTRMALSLIYTPLGYSSYIHPYPYAGDESPVPGPFEVFTVLEALPGPGGPRFGLDAPFASGAFPEHAYLVAEPAYRLHRASFEARAGQLAALGPSCHPRWHDCALHIVNKALQRRLAQREGGAPAPGAGPTARAIERLALRLEEEYEPGRESGRYRSIDEFWPRLIDALGPAAPAP